MKLRVLSALLGCITVALARRVDSLVVQDGTVPARYGPLGTEDKNPMKMAALSSEAYTVFAHDAYPKHSVRVKQLHGFCDDSVKCVPLCFRRGRERCSRKLDRAYGGYVDVEARHLWFYFFESRRAPEKDDVVMWINGGALASALLYLTDS